MNEARKAAEWQRRKRMPLGKPHLFMVNNCWYVLYMRNGGKYLVIGVTPSHAWESYLENTQD